MNKKYKIGVGILLALFVVAAVVYLRRTNIPVLEPKGPIADHEFRLLVILALLSLIVVVPVFTLLFAFAWKYREGNTKAKYLPDWDHNRIIETIWWLIPSALILVVGVIIWNSSHELDPYKALSSSKQPITVEVIALDWKWLFIYPQQHIASVNLVQFPRDTPVNFDITADAPMNSFWIPQLGGQIYAMPGMSTQLHLLANRDGDYYGSSANISGNGFAGMHFIARASSSNDFERWVNNAKQSRRSLSQSVYNTLAKPTQNNTVAYYTANDSELYNKVLLKYLSPLSQLPSTNNGIEQQLMQGMAMQ